MEFCRTGRGARQRVVSYLGEMDEAGRVGVGRAANRTPPYRQGVLFEDAKPECVEVYDLWGRVENHREFGGHWLGLELRHQSDWSSISRNGCLRGVKNFPDD